MTNRKSSELWKIVKDKTKSNKGGTPQYININNKNYSKPCEIATIACDFFINKIVKIQQKFRNSICNPIVILNFLIPKNDNLFKLPLLTIKETSKYIKKIQEKI